MSDTGAPSPAAALYPNLPSEHSAHSAEATGPFQAQDHSATDPAVASPEGQETAPAPEWADAVAAEHPRVDFLEPLTPEGQQFEWGDTPPGWDQSAEAIQARDMAVQAMADAGVGEGLGQEVIRLAGELGSVPLPLHDQAAMTRLRDRAAEHLNAKYGTRASLVLEAAQDMVSRWYHGMEPGPARDRAWAAFATSRMANDPRLIEVLAARRAQLRW